MSHVTHRWVEKPSTRLDRQDVTVVGFAGNKGLISPPVSVATFDSGATRNSDAHKYDFEGFLSPAVLERYGEYMHAHRVQSDGTLRDSDNWQKGIPLEKYRKSLVRHMFDLWRCWRTGRPVIDKDTGKEAGLEDLCCAVLFNVMGMLHEMLK